MIRLIADAGIRANLWIDGSFVTSKLDPKDIDLVLDIGNQEEFTEQQQNFIRWFNSTNAAHVKDMLNTFGCDCYAAATADHEYWSDMFGSDRNENPKGIVVVAINGGAP